MENDRKKAAELAVKFYKDEITFEEFLIGVPKDETDEDISELIYLIYHEPKKGGFMGAGDQEYAKYKEQIKHLIDKLL